MKFSPRDVAPVLVLVPVPVPVVVPVPVPVPVPVVVPVVLVLEALLRFIVPVQSELTVYVPVNWRKLSELLPDVVEVEVPEGATMLPLPSN